MTRDQVRDRLISARHSPTGPIDADKAVGGIYGVPTIGGSWLAVEPGATFTLTAQHTGEGPFTYQWPNGATTPSATFTAGPAGTVQTITAFIQDTGDGTVHQASTQVESVAPPPPGPICRNPRFC